MVAALALALALAPGPSQYPQCPQEDSPRCVWRANVQGDGFGDSFVSGTGTYHHTNRRTYVSDRIARKVDRHNHWRRVPARLVGTRVDLVGSHRSKVVTKSTVRSVGPTTLFIWPYRGRVGTS